MAIRLAALANLLLGPAGIAAYSARHPIPGVTPRDPKNEKREPFAIGSRHLTTPETRAIGAGRCGDQAFFGRFAPYFERACLRSFTPCRSSEPRTM